MSQGSTTVKPLVDCVCAPVPSVWLSVKFERINKLRARGMELHDAVITGASVRLRAELLSALIGSISLIPFIISSGTGAEIEKPLAIVVVGGLVTRPIKIVILPMVYEWVERGAARRAARRLARDGEATLEQQ